MNAHLQQGSTAGVGQSVPGTAEATKDSKKNVVIPVDSIASHSAQKACDDLFTRTPSDAVMQLRQRVSVIMPRSPIRLRDLRALPAEGSKKNIVLRPLQTSHFRNVKKLTDTCTRFSVLADSARSAPNSNQYIRWECVGAQRPDIGKEITNDALATALQHKLEFSRHEFLDFQSSSLSPNGDTINLPALSYIQAGDMYFELAGLGNEATTDELHAESIQLRNEVKRLSKKLDNCKQMLKHARASYEVAVETLMRTLTTDETVAVALLMERDAAEMTNLKGNLMSIEEVRSLKIELMMVCCSINSTFDYNEPWRATFAGLLPSGVCTFSCPTVLVSSSSTRQSKKVT